MSTTAEQLCGYLIQSEKRCNRKRGHRQTFANDHEWSSDRPSPAMDAKALITSLAQEAEREARAIHARRNIPNAPYGSAYDVATRDAQHLEFAYLEFAAAWLRQKA